jgi:hypothetical protein
MKVRVLVPRAFFARDLRFCSGSRIPHSQIILTGIFSGTAP